MITKKIRKITLLTPVLLFSSIIPSYSGADVNICNYSQKPIRYAEILLYGLNMFKGKWQIDGWYELNDGCKTLVSHNNVYSQFYLAIKTKTLFGWKDLKHTDINLRKQEQNMFGNKRIEYHEDPIQICMATQDKFIDEYRLSKEFNTTGCGNGLELVPFPVWLRVPSNVSGADVVWSGSNIQIR